MSRRVQVGVLLVTTILLIVLFALRVPDRFLQVDEQLAPDGSGGRGYAADGYNIFMEQAAAAVQQGNFEKGVDLLLRIPGGGDRRAVEARMHAADLLFTRLYEPTRGFVVLDELLAYIPEQIEARILMARYFDACGRQFDADVHRREVVRFHRETRTELLQLAENLTGVGDVELLHVMYENNPDDINVRLGVALLDLSSGALEQAETALREVVVEDPRLWTAQAGLGAALIAQKKFPEFETWRTELPQEAKSSSEIWVVRGQGAVKQDRSEVAVRCFVEALRIDPDHLEACQGAAQQLAALGRTEDAARFESRASLLQELAEVVSSDPEMNQLATVDQAAQLTQKLGRSWETFAWTTHQLALDPTNPYYKLQFKHLGAVLTTESVERMRSTSNPANRVDVSDLPDE